MGYLEANPSVKLSYRQGGRSGMDGFADSDWGDSASRRSSTGLMASCSTPVVQLRSKMQKRMSLSKAAAEYHAASEMAIESMHLRNLLSSMG